MTWRINQTQDQPEKTDQLILRLLKSRRLITAKSEIALFTSPLNLTIDYLLKETAVSPAQLKKAVARINQAIKAKQPIIIYGDYDVDGVCASAILWQTLHRLQANVLPFIPSRQKHGYGLSNKGIKQSLKLFPSNQSKPPLIITVDNGITAASLINQYQNQGFDFIITDHHQLPSQKPRPLALIHSSKVCGTSLSFLLSFALTNTPPPLDLVALATVCDQLPLLGLNRQLVIQGLNQIRSPQRLGLKTLFSQAGITNFQQIDTYHLGFVIGPRLNAAGRLGHALDALRLLCTPNQTQALQLSQELNRLNKDRQDLTQTGISLAFNQITTKNTIPKIILAKSPHFHEGIIGLIAAKLTQHFHRPSIAIAQANKISKASARSIPKVDILQLLRQANFPLLDLGGHAGAAGFTINTDQIEALAQELPKIGRGISSKQLIKTTTIDLLLHPQQDLSIVNQVLKKLGPFGPGFPQPLFALKDLQLQSSRSVGANKSHLQLSLKHPQGQFLKAICFNQAHSYQLNPGDKLDSVFHLQENTYQGNTSLQLNIQSLKKTS